MHFLADAKDVARIMGWTEGTGTIYSIAGQMRTGIVGAMAPIRIRQKYSPE